MEGARAGIVGCKRDIKCLCLQLSAESPSSSKAAYGLHAKRASYASANPARRIYLDRELMPSSEQIEPEVKDGKGQRSDWVCNFLSSAFQRQQRAFIRSIKGNRACKGDSRRALKGRKRQQIKGALQLDMYRACGAKQRAVSRKRSQIQGNAQSQQWPRAKQQRQASSNCRRTLAASETRSSFDLWRFDTVFFAFGDAIC
jgi:hypothetical protein